MGSVKLILLALIGAVSCIVITKAAFLQVSTQVSALQPFGEMCDSKIMRRWANDDCNSSDFSGLMSIIEKCNATCKEVPVNADTHDSTCCLWKCAVFNFSILEDGKINKTALSSLFGAVGDPKTIENIGECEAIGNIA